MVEIKLRNYQRAAVDAIYDWFDESAGNPLVVVPTGGGKSIIIGTFIREVIEIDPGAKILMVTHVKELIQQNAQAVRNLWPEAPIGIYSAGLNRRQWRAQIVCGGVQSMFRRAALFGHVDLILIDEAHLVSPKGMGMYQQLLRELRDINPKVKVIGFTATPFRLDTGDQGSSGEALFDGGQVFNGIAYECDLLQLIEDGWLSPVRNKSGVAEIDTDGVKTRGGEWVPGELATAADTEGLVEAQVKEVLVRGADRKKWLVFCCGVEHAKHYAQCLTDAGIRVGWVFGHTPLAHRDRVLNDFKQGLLQAVCNVGVLTTGFDAPDIDLIVLARPTKSPGLYVQMIGRGLRIAPEKADCLVLDFGGNVLRHGPLDQVRVDQPALLKQCPECREIVLRDVRTCPECTFEWPEREVAPDDAGDGDGDGDVTPKEQSTRPDEESPMFSGKARDAIETWEIDRIEYRRHEKPGKPPSLRVSYRSGFTRQASEWICFEHGGYARSKAEAWWRRRCGQEPVPSNVEEARLRIDRGEIHGASSITVDVRGEWPQIKGVTIDADSNGWRADAADAKMQDAKRPSFMDSPMPVEINSDDIPF